MPTAAGQLLTNLKEMAFALSRFTVNYVVTTPRGNSSRFQRTSQLSNIGPGNPRSETAVRSYLLRLHPGCDVQINSLDFS